VKENRKGVSKMKKPGSLICNLVLPSALLMGATTARADHVIVKTPLDLPGYCHMQFPEVRPDTLPWDRTLLDPSSGNSAGFSDPCDHDPTGSDVLESERRLMLRGFFGEGE
jgi:hypothetical protein